MTYLSEYLERNFQFEALRAERAAQLSTISKLRGRDILVIAANMELPHAPVSITHSDILPINDQLSRLSGKAIDIILETPGGSGETTEHIVKLLRQKYETVGVIVPGCAKSAGTIMAMAADEILMEPASALGPIDAQIMRQGKVFSAEALIEGFNRIKEDVVQNKGALNMAYVPILQAISPGELQGAQNSLDFAKTLVRDWLARYKFKEWHTHSSTGQPVTPEDRTSRAAEIAEVLCKHSKWLTHARCITMDQLRDMKLLITDYSQTPDLAEAIRRYYALLQILFSSNAYKVFETPFTQIVRVLDQGSVPPPPPALGPKRIPKSMDAQVTCQACRTPVIVQLNFFPGVPLAPGRVEYPSNEKVTCPGCGSVTDLQSVRETVEQMHQRPVIR